MDIIVIYIESGKLRKNSIISAICLLAALSPLAAEPNDFVLEGVFEAALDLPRIYFLFQRDPNGDPIEVEGQFELNYAFLDTGASGLVFSRETIDIMGLSIDPNAQFADIGVAGSEYFDVTESLWIGLEDLEAADPYITQEYGLQGHWRFQAKQEYAGILEQPIDIIGMPVMAGKTAVLHASATNALGFFAADVRETDDPSIPAVDFQVALRMENFNTPHSPENIPPLPVLAYNPVIDNITTINAGNSSTGTWLLDTGATISFISTQQAIILNLLDANGDPLSPPLLEVPVGGVGSNPILIPVYQIDSLSVPTLSGFDLVYADARVGILDISVLDEFTGEFITLHGVFGSNFLCASAALDPLTFFPIDIAQTAYDWIVVDSKNGLLGFDVNPVYPVPTGVGGACGSLQNPWPLNDFDHNCVVDLVDLLILVEHWLNDCNRLNWFCGQADINSDGIVDGIDFATYSVMP